MVQARQCRHVPFVSIIYKWNCGRTPSSLKKSNRLTYYNDKIKHWITFELSSSLVDQLHDSFITVIDSKPVQNVLGFRSLLVVIRYFLFVFFFEADPFFNSLQIEELRCASCCAEDSMPHVIACKRLYRHGFLIKWHRNIEFTKGHISYTLNRRSLLRHIADWRSWTVKDQKFTLLHKKL